MSHIINIILNLPSLVNMSIGIQSVKYMSTDVLILIVKNRNKIN